MCGLPFSGKTTLSKQIAKHTKSKRISFDELWVEIESKMNAEDRLKPSWGFVVEEAKKMIGRFLSQGKSVVYDDTNARKEHRDALVSIGEDHHAQSQVVYLNIPKELIIKRRRRNLINQNRHDVEDDNFNSVLSQFEKPSHSEGAIVFKTNDVVGEWLVNNF